MKNRRLETKDLRRNPVSRIVVRNIMSGLHRHRGGGGFMKTIRLVSKVFGKTRPYNTIKYAPPLQADMI